MITECAYRILCFNLCMNLLSSTVMPYLQEYGHGSKSNLSFKIISDLCHIYIIYIYLYNIYVPYVYHISYIYIICVALFCYICIQKNLRTNHQFLGTKPTKMVQNLAKRPIASDRGELSSLAAGCRGLAAPQNGKKNLQEKIHLGH